MDHAPGVFAGDCFLLQHVLHERAQSADIRGQHGLHVRIALLQDLVNHLVVHIDGAHAVEGQNGVLLGVGAQATLPVNETAQPYLRHAPLIGHGVHVLGGLLQVIRGACGDLVLSTHNRGE